MTTPTFPRTRAFAAEHLATTPRRVAVTAITGAIGGWVASFLAFVAVIVGTGCFISCTEARPLFGMLAWTGAVLIVSGWGAMVAWAMGKGVHARQTAKVLFVVLFLAGLGPVVVG